MNTVLITDVLKRRLHFIILATATILFLGMLNELGWTDLGRHLAQVGYHWPLLFVPYGFVNCLGALSWGCLLPERRTRPPFRRLFLLRLAGDSLNQLTPTASIGGEAFRVQRLKAQGIAWEQATVSVVILKGVLALSLVLYVLLGLTLSIKILGVSTPRMGVLSLAVLLLGAGSLSFLIVQRRGPCVLGIRLLEKCGLCPAKLKAKEPELAGLDSCLAEFYHEHPGRGLLAFMLFFVSWLFHGLEVYVIFQLLGHPISWNLAISLDALVTLISAMGFMIPASMGVQDAGAVLLSLGFDLGAVLGGAFAVLRRLREVFWLSLGLLVAAMEK